MTTKPDNTIIKLDKVMDVREWFIPIDNSKKLSLKTSTLYTLLFVDLMGEMRNLSEEVTLTME